MSLEFTRIKSTIFIDIQTQKQRFHAVVVQPHRLTGTSHCRTQATNHSKQDQHGPEAQGESHAHTLWTVADPDDD